MFKNKSTQLFYFLMALLIIVLPIFFLFTPVFPSSSFLLKCIASGYFIVCSVLMLMNKMNVILAINIVALVCIPSDAVGLISGYNYSSANGIVNISIIGYFCMITLVQVFVLGNWNSVQLKNRLYSRIITSIVMFLACLILFRFMINKSGVLSNKLFDNYLLPICLFILASMLDKQYTQRLLQILYFFVLVSAVICITEYFLKRSLLFHDYYYSNISWYRQIIRVTRTFGYQFRSTGLLGHPLLNGTYFIFAVCYLGEYGKKGAFRIIQYIVILLALITINSRGALLTVALYFIYKTYKDRSPDMIVLLVLALAFVLYKGWGDIYASLFSRDAGGASLMSRVNAIKSIFRIPIFDWLFGVGFNNVSNYMNSNINFEIGPMIMALEIGLIPFSMLGFIVYSIIKFIKKYVTVELNKTKVILIFITFNLFTYNSIGDPGTLNYLVWLIAGLMISQSSLSDTIQLSASPWLKQQT